MDQPEQIIAEIVPTPPPVSVNIQPSSSAPKSNKGPLIIFLVVLSLILVGGLVYAGVKIGKKQSQTPVLPTPVPTEVLVPTITLIPTEAETPTTILSTPTPDPTAGWKSYTNTKYGYQFKYPTGRSFKISLNNPESSPFYVIRETISSGYVDGWDILVSVWDNPNQLTLVEWLKSLKEANALPLPTENKQIIPNFSVANLEAFRTWNDPLSNGEQPGKCVQACPILDVYFVKKNLGYRVELSYTKEVDAESQELFNQILSTFKFLE